jgi:ComF family protein
MHIWERIVDVVFPPSPGEKLIRTATEEDLVQLYRPRTVAGVVVLSSYKHPLIKATITTAKFSHNQKAAKMLAHLLTHWGTKHAQPKTVFVPIPLHATRERERGYNQVSRIIEHCTFPHHQISNTLLKRTRPTVPQTTLSGDARRKNLTGAFTIHHPELDRLIGQGVTQIIICDDVLTTGSTLEEARRTLAPHLPKTCTLLCLAWAH